MRRSRSDTKARDRSYLPPDLQRAYKARCVLLGIEMQDALEQAIRDWLDKNPA